MKTCLFNRRRKRPWRASVREYFWTISMGSDQKGAVSAIKELHNHLHQQVSPVLSNLYKISLNLST